MLLDKNNNIKIVDFGLSNTYEQVAKDNNAIKIIEEGKEEEKGSPGVKSEQLKTACGSPCYAAP